MTSKFVLSATALAIGIAAAAMPAAAASKHYGNSYDRTDVRQDKQAKRIQQGIRSGELTHREVTKLNNQQDRIRLLERNAERDGHVSRQERNRIEHAQDRASRTIFAEKHDLQDRDRHSGKRRWFKWRGHDNHGPKPWYRRWY